MAEQPTKKPTAAQIERKRVDDFMKARLQERRMAKQSKQVTNTYSQGFANLIDILTRKSPIYDTLGGKK